MNRRKFIGLTGGALLATGTGAYLISDKSNVVRNDLSQTVSVSETLKFDEREILYLASLAPSGHNTQPWFVQYIEPYHWIVGNDKSKWLPAVDPTQRETMLSIGTFIQNLELAAGDFGYACNWNLLATTNQDERVIEVRLSKKEPQSKFDVEKIKSRRTVRSNYLKDELRNEDAEYVLGSENEFIHYLPTSSKEGKYLDEQTIEANRIQAYRDPAQQELAEWIRFSSEEAEKYRDGLTTASMEIEGIAGWYLRNFYDKESVMQKDFRDRGIDKVREQVASSAGWLVITSKNDSVETLLETGRRMQRLCLKVRDKNIAIHPMTQVLEEGATNREVNKSIGIADNIQFLLRTGYIKDYPTPVSLRRPVEWFVRTWPVRNLRERAISLLGVIKKGAFNHVP